MLQHLRASLAGRFRRWRLHRLRKQHTRLSQLHLRATTLYGSDLAQAVDRLVRLDDLAEQIRKLDPPKARTSPFVFEAPGWANTSKRDLTAEEALQRARELASAYYPLGAQTGIHSMIEWCGVMTEYVKMLEVASEAGHDPREVDQHHGVPVSAPDFMIAYFCEKLGCQLKPFIMADTTLWRTAISRWFPSDMLQCPCVRDQSSDIART